MQPTTWARKLKRKCSSAAADHLYQHALARYQRWLDATVRAKRFRKPETVGTRASLQAGVGGTRGQLLHEHAAVLRQLGQAAAAARREARAERLLRRALASRERPGKPDNLGISDFLLTLAEVLAARGKHAEAGPLYQRVLAIDQNHADEQLDHLAGPTYAPARARIASLLAHHQAPVLRNYAATLRALNQSERRSGGERQNLAGGDEAQVV